MSDDAGEAGSVDRDFRGGLFRGVSFAISIVLVTASSALLYRDLGVAATGSYLTIIALVALMRGISEGGITSLAIRELAVAAPPSRDALARNLTGVRLVLTVGFLAPLPLVAWLTDTSQALTTGVLLVAVGAGLQSYQEAISAGLIADGRLGTVAVIDLLRAVGSAATITAGVLVDARFEVFFLAPSAAALLSLLGSVLVLRSEGRYIPLLQPGPVRALVSDLLPLSVATFGQIAYFRLGIVLVAVGSTAIETGYFAAAFRIVEVLIILPGIVLSGLLPSLSRTAEDRDVFRETLRNAFGKACLLGGAVAVGLHAGAPVAIAVIAGPDFDPSVEVLRLMAYGIAASFPAYVLGMCFATQRMYRELVIANLSVLAIAVVAYVALAVTYGARGGGVATALGEVALLTVGLATLRLRRPEVAVAVRPLLVVTLLVAAINASVAFAAPPPLVAALLAPVLLLAVGVRLVPTAR